MIKQQYTSISSVLFVLYAISNPTWAAEEHAGNHAGMEHDEEHAAAFGEPAVAADADRTIMITARDTMRFEPQNLSIKAGETIRFVVNNTGQLPHSFTLGATEAQQEHEEEMQGMPMEMMAGHMKDEPTGMVVQPGQTDSITWHFSGNMQLEFACHMPGHYQAGMKGLIN